MDEIQIERQYSTKMAENKIKQRVILSESYVMGVIKTGNGCKDNANQK